MPLLSARPVRTSFVALLAVATSSVTGLALAGPAAAAPTTTRYVATSGDDTDNDCTDANNPCETIQHAVDQADAGDTVSVAGGTYHESVSIGIDLTVIGAADGSTTVDGDGDGDQTFAIQGDQSLILVTLQNLNISNNADAPGVVSLGVDLQILQSHVDHNTGGGVVAVFSSVGASGSTFSGNTISNGDTIPFADGSGLALLFAAAIVDHSTFAGNESAGVTLLATGPVPGPSAGTRAAVAQVPFGAAIDHSTISGNGSGGLVNFGGTAVLSTSTVSGNVAGGAVNVAATGLMDIENSTVTNTTPLRVDVSAAATSDVGGVLNLGQGTTELFHRPSAMALNRFTAQLGVHMSDARPSAVRVAARQATALAAGLDLGPGEVGLLGSIVAGQAGDLPDCSGDITDAGYNLDSDTDNTCGLTTGTNDVVSTDPMLGPLADNGGLTKTHLPKKGSAAIDAIPLGAANCSKKADDQRDVSRPQGSKCDIGAVEADQPPIVIHPPKLPHGTVGEAYTASITATGGLGPPYAISLVAGDMPPGLSFGDGGVISGTPTQAGHFPITVSVDDPVEKSYVIVIDAAAVAPTSTAAPTSTSAPPIANTGANTKPLTTWGIASILAGVLFLIGAGWIGRERYRRAH